MSRFVYNGQTSFKPRVLLRQSDGTGKTGLSSASTLTITLTQDGVDPSTLTKQAISAIGTFEQPSTASNVRIGEIDSVRTPGYYELQFHDTLLASLSSVKWLDLNIYSSSGLILNYSESFNVYQQDPSSLLVVTPLSTTVSAGEVSSNHLIAYQYATKPFVFTITDDTDTAVNLSGKTVKLCLYARNDPSTALFTISGTVGGTDSNQVTVTLTSTHTTTARVMQYKLWNTTDDTVLAAGAVTVEANPNTT